MSKFQMGDEVLIVEGVRGCIYGCTPEMEGMIGQIVHILSARPSISRDADVYRVVEDKMGFNWSEECFEFCAAESENEITISDEEFEDILAFLSESDHDSTPPNDTPS